MNNRTPTSEEKIKMYEDFLHQLNLYILCGDNERIKELLRNADDWSYAHRAGNGELGEEEIEENINKKFWNLLTTKK